MTKIPEKQMLIAEKFANLVGEALSLVDATLDSVLIPGEEYPKKEIFKKIFERYIYSLRNKLFDLSVQDALLGIEQEFAILLLKLEAIATAAFPDEVRRDAFILCLTDIVKEKKEQCKQVLEELQKVNK